MTRHFTKRVIPLFFLCLATFHASQAQESKPNPLCNQLSNLIESSKAGFVSMVGDSIDEKQRSYSSKLDLVGWTNGFVYPEASDGPYVLYVSLGGNNLWEIKRRYRAWVPKLAACLAGWRRTEVASKEDLKSVFRQRVEGPSIELEYNLEPSTVGDTKFDLYLTFMAPASVVEKNLSADLSSLINASRTGFTGIAGELDDEKLGSHKSTLRVSSWGSGWVYPKADDPHALYVLLGGNRISEIRGRYSRWVSKLTTCLPGWKRVETASAEEVKSVFREADDGPTLELEYNRKPSKVGSTKFDLYLTSQGPRTVSKGSP